MNNLDVERIKNCRKQNFEDEANNKQLDREDTITLLTKYTALHYKDYITYST